MKKNHSYEVLLLVVLGLFLAGYFAVTNLFRPMQSQIADTEKRIEQAENEVKTTYYTISSYALKCSRLESLTASVRYQRDRFYAGEVEETYLELIRSDLQGSGVRFTALSVQESTLKPSSLLRPGDDGSALVQLFTADSALSGSSLIKNNTLKSEIRELEAAGGRIERDVRITSMTLEANGKYASVLSFLRSILTGRKGVICNALTIEIPDNMDLTFTALPECRAVVSLIFLEIPTLDSLGVTPVPDPLVSYHFPTDILDGSYGTSRSAFDKIADLIYPPSV